MFKLKNMNGFYQLVSLTSVSSKVIECFGAFRKTVISRNQHKFKNMYGIKVTYVPFYDIIKGLGIKKVIYPKCNNIYNQDLLLDNMCELDESSQEYAIVSEPSGTQP